MSVSGRTADEARLLFHIASIQREKKISPSAKAVRPFELHCTNSCSQDPVPSTWQAEVEPKRCCFALIFIYNKRLGFSSAFYLGAAASISVSVFRLIGALTYLHAGRGPGSLDKGPISNAEEPSQMVPWNAFL